MAECVLCINPYDGQLCLVWKALTSTAPSYLDAEIDVQLSSEITGALRSLKVVKCMDIILHDLSSFTLRMYYKTDSVLWNT